MPSGAMPIADLMVRAAAHEIDNPDLVRLWQVALLTTDLSRRAWTAFEHWLTKADSDDTLRKATAALVTDLTALPTLRRRMAFRLARLSQFEDGLPEWLDAAMRK